MHRILVLGAGNIGALISGLLPITVINRFNSLT